MWLKIEKSHLFLGLSYSKFVYVLIFNYYNIICKENWKVDILFVVAKFWMGKIWNFYIFCICAVFFCFLNVADEGFWFD